MYGLVNNALREFIISSHDEDTWEYIVASTADLSDIFVSMGSYPDMLTYEIVEHACNRIGLEPSEFLEEFGKYWIGYAERHYGEYFHFAGATFSAFLENLDLMHERIRVSYPELRPPSFRVEHVAEGELRLHYLSEREGLEPFVLGLLKGLSRRMGVESEIVCPPQQPEHGRVFNITHRGVGSWSLLHGSH
jgi:hypothetical protein